MMRTVQPSASTTGTWRGGSGSTSGSPSPPSGLPPRGTRLPPGAKPSSISMGPSQSGSANKRVTARKSITTKCVLPSFSRRRVPRPMICLNSVMELIISSSTISLVILQSAPVESSLEVVAITGYFAPTEMKYLSFFLPSMSPPVIRTT